MKSKSNQRGPGLDSILSILKQNGVTLDSAKKTVLMTFIFVFFPPYSLYFPSDFIEKNENAEKINSWIKMQNRPVIILHHETEPASAVEYHRVLQSSSSNSTVPPLSEYQISTYQVILGKIK